MRLFILAASMIMAALYGGCTLSSPAQAAYASYRTEHFTIYFDEAHYSLGEVRRIAARKERLLVYVNTALSASFDGCIETYLTMDEATIAMIDGTVREARWYVINDGGHEIVHVVALYDMGWSLSGFMREGLAEAIELEMEYADAIAGFAHNCTTLGYGNYKWYAGQPGIYEQFIDDDLFTYTHFEYVRAGAFIRMLLDTYGLASVKRLYRASTTSVSYDLAYEFSHIFGGTLVELERQFEISYVPFYDTATVIATGGLP